MLAMNRRALIKSFPVGAAMAALLRHVWAGDPPSNDVPPNSHAAAPSTARRAETMQELRSGPRFVTFSECSPPAAR